MPRDLFGNVTRPSISIGNRKWYTVPVSLLSHAAIVLLLVAIPILAPAAMPSVFADDDMILITKIMPPTPPPPPRLGPEHLKPVENLSAAPVVAPDTIAPEPPAGDPPAPSIPGIIGGDPESLSTVLAPPPVVRPAAPPPPVRPGGAVRTPLKVHDVSPVYPPIAMQAHIQGIVIIEATISESGEVLNARVLRSVPLLDQAAIDAVRQWRYQPSMLNGAPVPVIMTVTVNFTLR
jgi:protein TonB